MTGFPPINIEHIVIAQNDVDQLINKGRTRVGKGKRIYNLSYFFFLKIGEKTPINLTL